MLIGFATERIYPRSIRQSLGVERFIPIIVAVPAPLLRLIKLCIAEPVDWPRGESCSNREPVDKGTRFHLQPAAQARVIHGAGRSDTLFSRECSPLLARRAANRATMAVAVRKLGRIDEFPCSEQFP